MYIYEYRYNVIRNRLFCFFIYNKPHTTMHICIVIHTLYTLYCVGLCHRLTLQFIICDRQNDPHIVHIRNTSHFVDHSLYSICIHITYMSYIYHISYIICYHNKYTFHMNTNISIITHYYIPVT